MLVAPVIVVVTACISPHFFAAVPKAPSPVARGTIDRVLILVLI